MRAQEHWGHAAPEQNEWSLAHSRESWSQQTQLPDSRLLTEQLDKRTHRPAATWQLCGEFGVAGLDSLVVSASKLRLSPQRRVDVLNVLWDGCH
jgi:hypothetical protein